MSNQREQFSRWTLPRIVHPPKTRKFVICVPDEQFYLAAFRGLLIELTYSKNWQRDTAHTAAVVSRVWQQALESVLCDDCANIGIVESDDDMQFRIKPGDPCIIQTLCGDGTWLDWYDPRGCMPGGVGQPGPDDPVDVGDCREFDVLLPGSGLWKLPVPVSSNDTIEITEAHGGTYDGAELAWRCANGNGYVLNTCSGGTITEGGDPMPATPHMRLIAGYNGVFVDAYDTTITIPAGLAEQDLVFQVNDSQLYDNAGSLNFHVKYCHNSAAPSGDCQESDFTIDAQSWAVILAASGFGVYNAGNYWESEFTNLGGGVTYEQLRIFRSYVGHISNITVVYSAAQDGYLGGSRDGSEPTAGPVLFNVAIVAGAMQTFTIPLNVDTTNHVRIDLSRDVDAANLLMKIHHIEICP